MQLSERIKKCKQYNKKENQLLQQQIELLKAKEMGSIEEIDRERLSLMQELHTSR